MQALVQTRLCTSIRCPVQNKYHNDSLSAFVFAGQKWKSLVWLCAKKKKMHCLAGLRLAGFCFGRLGLYQWCFYFKDHHQASSWLAVEVDWACFYSKWPCLPTAELKGHCRVWCSALITGCFREYRESEMCAWEWHIWDVASSEPMPFQGSRWGSEFPRISKMAWATDI